MVTLVPENPGEVSTEGGLDLVAMGAELSQPIATLKGADIQVCAFVDPNVDQIHAASQLGFDAVELCTSRYSESADREVRSEELEVLQGAARLAAKKGLLVHAGHGLDYHNISALATTPEISEFSIGHSIVGRAVMVGMERAVREMLEQILQARAQKIGDAPVV
jgi:pyridoxine 5-phosphate synthase